MTTRCTILANDGTLIAQGSNRCGNPQPVCPRQGGEGYAKCTSVCQQDGHAEQVAARRASELYTREQLISMRAAAYLSGHTYMCQDCQHALTDAGVTIFHICSPRTPQ